MAAVFAQADVRWASERLGGGRRTLAEAGCLVCALASITCDLVRPSDPRRLNRWLTAQGCFLPDGGLRMAGLLPLGLRLAGWVDCYQRRIAWRRVTGDLNAGRGVLALIDARPGQTPQAHWVRLLAVHAGDCTIMDPWAGALVSLAAEYGAPGWDARQAIFVYAAYEPATTARRRGQPERRGEICRRKPAVGRDIEDIVVC